MQHPFPAQTQTTETAHLIVAEQATQDGTHGAITRARDRTDIYAATARAGADADRIQAHAVTVGRSEPDLPSIRVPLAYERAIITRPDGPTSDREAQGSDGRDPEPLEAQVAAPAAT